MFLSIVGYYVRRGVFWWRIFFLRRVFFILLANQLSLSNRGVQLFFLREELLRLFFLLGRKIVLILSLLLKLGAGVFFFWLYNFLTQIQGSVLLWFFLVKKLVLWVPLSLSFSQRWFFLLLGVFIAHILSILRGSFEVFFLFGSAEGRGLLLTLLSVEQLSFLKALFFYLSGLGLTLIGLLRSSFEIEGVYLFFVLPVGLLWWVKLRVLLGVLGFLVVAVLSLSFFRIALGRRILLLWVIFRVQRGGEIFFLRFFLLGSLVLFLL